MTEVTPDPQEHTIDVVEIETVEKQSFLTDVVVLLIKVPLFILVTTIYAVGAGFIWVALMARMSLIFTIGIVTAALEQRTSKSLSKSMDDAIRFFPAGFGIIFRSFFQQSQIEEKVDQPNIGRLVVETMWSLAFWTGMVIIAREVYGHDSAIESKITKIVRSTFSILTQ